MFENRDHELEDIDLNQLLLNHNTPKLTIEQSTQLEGILNENELSIALKNMKNNKTPGVDGFPAEFFKVFWRQLKYFVLRSLNFSYETGILPVSLRHCIISCLPKGNKPREYLKNWRPISLLSVVYKIASTAIANRLKNPMEFLISRTQTGFIKGRFIGESTRLVYDIMQVSEHENLNGLLMLIDFEKAFDSISWKFLYKVLEFFGFHNMFIKWIKLFNTDIKASVIQCGKMSETFNILRGARQGDPIAAYLFIFCAEILSILVKENKFIEGITLNGHEYKLTQFADDTTLFLSGKKESLQAALNILELFGSLSGLKMNTEKTKIIWIGRKKHSKDKLDINVALNWGQSQFVLLGLTFSTNLDEMVKINFDKAISGTKEIISYWSKRNLTPIGKVTVIKTFVISKLNHLLISLPTPSPSIVNTLNDMMFKYLWNYKPDKIKRMQITQDYQNGGLRMINLDSYIKALKSTWIRRLLTNNGALWIDVFEHIIGNVTKIVVLGPQWCNVLKQSIVNDFWKSVLDAWEAISEIQPIKCKHDILSSSLWYNKKIAQYPLFISNWFQNGIHFVGDILDDNGNIRSIEDLTRNYHLNNINFLEYHKVNILIKRFLGKYRNTFGNFASVTYPIIPQHLSILYKNRSGARDMYDLVNSRNVELKGKMKWNLEFETEIDNFSWRTVFKACFKTTKDTSLIWLQYRILSRIIGTRELLYKLKIHDTDLCRLCGQEIETIIHLFCKCTKSIDLWNDLRIWICNLTQLGFSLDPQSIILGYLLNEANFEPINIIYMIVKQYIFHCAYFKRPLNIFTLQNQIKRSFIEQEMLAKINFTVDKFNKVYDVWRPLFQSIP